MKKFLKVGRVLLSIIAIIVFAYGMINFLIASSKSVRDYKKGLSEYIVTSSGTIIHEREEERLKAPLSTDGTAEFYSMLGVSGCVLFVLVNIRAIIRFGAEQNRCYLEARQARKEQRKKKE